MPVGGAHARRVDDVTAPLTSRCVTRRYGHHLRMGSSPSLFSIRPEWQFIEFILPGNWPEEHNEPTLMGSAHGACRFTSGATLPAFREDFETKHSETDVLLMFVDSGGIVQVKINSEPDSRSSLLDPEPE